MPSAAAFRFALTASHRVIDWIHRHAPHRWANALPPAASRFAACNIHVIYVADLADCRISAFIDFANLARWHFHQRVSGFAVIQNDLLTCAASDLTATTGCELDVVNA